MTASSLIIVADRGSLRAYRVEETPTRGPHLELVQAFEVTDVMDAASTRHQTPMTDWPELEAEIDRRVCKELAAEIAKTVERDLGEGWSFAAPESIHGKIVEQLPPEIRERIVEHVESDLVKLPVSALLSHFRSLQPI
ncbi:MAG: host attachment protein [Alphaproteobacteria bacterium]